VYEENSGSTEEYRAPLSFSGLVILLVIGLISGAGLWGIYLGTRFLLMLCGVKFNSM
jgi:hypothetical protein